MQILKVMKRNSYIRDIKKWVLILPITFTIVLFISGCDDNGGGKSKPDSTKESEHPTKSEHPERPK